ncbi:MAG: hydantoinase/oxoprolinase family protein [Candidatus Lustribacter sp.]|jgi:N-methylhydantoinase A/oxoprolinase/acetone carboxylase beta subunit
MPMVRIGIDVGGTFTDVVAVDAATRAMTASIKVPTTHDHPDGVAAGIVDGLQRLLTEHAIDPGTVTFIAHSTTQATNALLEGDVARVGVVRFGSAFARAAMRFAPIPLAAGVALSPTFFDAADAQGDPWFERARAAGVDALVASEAFAVDRPEREQTFVAAARARGFAATCGSEVSTMYGLRARTRTAAINAAILPRMLRTARMTRRAVDDARIPAPLMIMRSDGGVMDVEEVERRPILTMLSGPAAGIAGALFHENVTDGIFIEVGGTSADCSVIRRGRPQLRPARIGGHRTLLRTLDVRTLGVAGGSLVHVTGGTLGAVGPRSAHIAGYRYAAFSTVATIAAARVALEDGIAALADGDGRIAITPTCAANALGCVPEGAFARGNAEAARLACERVGAELGLDGDGFARAILERASATLKGAVEELIADYELDRSTVVLVGGGGGAAALIPFAAAALGFEYRIAKDAEVIAPLGVALALVRDVVERTIVDPAPADLVRIRREAIDAAIRAGAAPDGVEVVVEVDRARNRVRATASGASVLDEGARSVAAASEDERSAAARRALRADASAVAVAARTPGFLVIGGNAALAIVDERAVVRLIVPRANAIATTAGQLAPAIRAAIEEFTNYGDVGKVLPDLWLLAGARIVELTGLTEVEGALALAADDVAGLPDDTLLALVVVAKRA